MLKINEIFHSIQGESSYVGNPTVFVRTSGCHLRCNYCDTKYAYYEGKMQSVDDVIATVKSYDCPFVCITGGEPLLQPDVNPLMSALCDIGYTVSLETGGDKDCIDVDPRVKKIIDIKTPDSGEAGKFNVNNLNFKNTNTEYKFVICSEKDFDWSIDFASVNNLFNTNLVLFSPSHGKISPQWLAKKILSTNAPARLQLQIHKYIWDEYLRGV